MNEKLKATLQSLMTSGKLTKNPEDYDPMVSVEEILERKASGQYDEDDMLAHLISVNIRMEEENKGLRG